MKIAIATVVATPAFALGSCTSIRNTSSSPRAKCCRPAPPVIEFDQAGNVVQLGAVRARVLTGPSTNMACTHAKTRAEICAESIMYDAGDNNLCACEKISIKTYSYKHFPKELA